MKLHKLFFITCLTILFVVKIFGQAQIEIPFTVSDSNGNTRILIFGLDLTATSGIDPILGEAELPPLPPGGAFDVRFISLAGQSQLGEGTIKDIRNAQAFLFSGTYTHRIKFQAGDPNWEQQTITVSWNLPPEIVAGSTISNTGFGGPNSQPFVGSGSMTVTNPTDYDRLNIVIVYYNIGPASPVFGITPSSLNFGSVAVGSSAMLQATVSNTGIANLIISNVTSSNAQFTFTPNVFPITILFGNNQTFDVTFTPTSSGWQSANLVFTHNAAGSPTSYSVIGTTIGFMQATVEIPFTVSDSNGNTRILIFGLDLTATSGIDPHLGEFELYPGPLPGPFDARFISMFGQSQLGEGTLKDIRNASLFPFSGAYAHRIRFQPEGPNWQQQTITIQWNLPPEIIQGSTISSIGGEINQPFIGTGSLTIDPLDYDRLNIFVVYSDIVPVELISFKGLVSGYKIELKWSTATETNNSGFEILRKVQNDIDWETIGFVPGFGTTTEPKSYSFINENVSTGLYKYRLKQIDFDGTFTYSNELEVEVDFTPKEFVLYQNYPNPFNPKTVISYQLPVTGNVTLKVYDILGNEVATLVNEEKQPGVYEVEFNTSSLSSSVSAKGGYASGVYFYQLNAGSFSSIKKMILIK